MTGRRWYAALIVVAVAVSSGCATTAQSDTAAAPSATPTAITQVAWQPPVQPPGLVPAEPSVTPTATATQTTTATATQTATATATATRTATQTATQTATVTATPTPTPTPSATTSPTNSAALTWLWWLLAVVAVAAVIGGIIWATTRSRKRREWDTALAGVTPVLTYLADSTVPELVADPMATPRLWPAARADLEQRRVVLAQLTRSAPDDEREVVANALLMTTGELRAAIDVRATATNVGRIPQPSEAGGNVDLLTRRDVLHAALQRAAPFVNPTR